LRAKGGNVKDNPDCRSSAAPNPGVSAVRAAELSIIIPTFNERDNIAGVIAAVAEALPNMSWEIVFVDDNSPDGTASLVRDIAQADPRVRCLHRFGRRGLSSACVEGILSTSSPVVAVMDADRQHDEGCLARMVEVLNGPMRISRSAAGMSRAAA
jgi:dolichol-phosphate mannosyltransferase